MIAIILLLSVGVLIMVCMFSLEVWGAYERIRQLSFECSCWEQEALTLREELRRLRAQLDAPESDMPYRAGRESIEEK